MGVSPISPWCLYVPKCVYSPLGVDNASTTLRTPSRLAHGQSKPFIVGVSPAQRPGLPLCWWVTTPVGVDISYLLMGYTPLQVPIEFTILMMRFSLLESNRESRSAAGIFPSQRFGLSLRWLSHAASELTHPICRWVTLSLQNLIKFVGMLMGLSPLGYNTECLLKHSKPTNPIGDID